MKIPTPQGSKTAQKIMEDCFYISYACHVDELISYGEEVDKAHERAGNLFNLSVERANYYRLIWNTEPQNLCKN